MKEFHRGDFVTVRGVFTDENGDPLDPDAVIVQIVNPSGVASSATYGVDSGLIKVSPGVYDFGISADLSGVYRYRWLSTGIGQAAEFDAFLIGADVADWDG